MTDTSIPPVSPDEDDPNKGIQVDKHGDPLPQGTRMIERESYERVIEGLKIAADACQHLVAQFPAEAHNWRVWSLNLDQCRRICIQHAGIEDTITSKETVEMRGEPMRYRQARDRLVEGLNQASGGCRQLATCFRMDYFWAKCATQLENMARKVRQPKLMRAGNPLLLPTGYTRH